MAATRLLGRKDGDEGREDAPLNRLWKELCFHYLVSFIQHALRTQLI